MGNFLLTCPIGLARATLPGTQRDDRFPDSVSAGMDIGVWSGRRRVTYRHTYLNGTPWHANTLVAPGGSEPDRVSRSTHQQLKVRWKRAPLRRRGIDITSNHRPDHTPVAIPALTPAPLSPLTLSLTPSDSEPEPSAASKKKKEERMSAPPLFQPERLKIRSGASSRTPACDPTRASPAPRCNAVSSCCGSRAACLRRSRLHTASCWP